MKIYYDIIRALDDAYVESYILHAYMSSKLNRYQYPSVSSFRSPAHGVW